MRTIDQVSHELQRELDKKVLATSSVLLHDQRVQRIAELSAELVLLMARERVSA